MRHSRNQETKGNSEATLRYIRAISSLLHLDIREYRKRSTTQEWIERVTSNNAQILESIRRDQNRLSESLSLPLRKGLGLEEVEPLEAVTPFGLPQRTTAPSNRFLTLQLERTNKQNSKPYLPAIRASKLLKDECFHRTSAKKHPTKRNKEFTSINLVSLDKTTIAENLELKPEISRPKFRRTYEIQHLSPLARRKKERRTINVIDETFDDIFIREINQTLVTSSLYVKTENTVARQSPKGVKDGINYAQLKLARLQCLKAVIHLHSFV